MSKIQDLRDLMGAAAALVGAYAEKSGLASVFAGASPRGDKIEGNKRSVTGLGINMTWQRLVAIETQPQSKTYQLNMVTYGLRISGGGQYSMPYEVELSRRQIEPEKIYTRADALNEIERRDQAYRQITHPTRYVG